MSRKLQFKLPFDSSLEELLKKKYPKVKDYRILSKSLDARGSRQGKKPSYHYTLEAVYDDEHFKGEPEEFISLKPFKKKPIIIGAGPAGLFCALRFSEYGIPCTLLERGDSAQKRMRKIAKFWRYGDLDPDTNVCFGEGGAGLYSDGKLITRIKSPYIKYVMKRLVDFGAPEEVAYLSNPHLGSNKIRNLISTISEYLSNKGAEIRHHAKVEKLLYQGSKVIGVKLRDGEKIYSEHVILATGHSAKEMYHHLYENNVSMKQKDFAIGVRVEHRRRYLDSCQYGDFSQREELGAARYKLSFHDKISDRGSYSFCMCPGGHVLSSSTEAGAIVVNGMSNYARRSPWSNSALVVSVKAGEDFSASDILAGLKYQEKIEKLAYQVSSSKASGREIPSMSLKDFLAGKLINTQLPVSSCPSGTVPSDLREILPEYVLVHLKNALEQFDKKIPGFVSEDALFLAPETRTSAPITIERHAESLLSLSHEGLYPCGEGAGHAGGITSAAVDGIRVAEAIIQSAAN